jgi:hypothetical protein
MLDKAFEFLRICDPQPVDEKVRHRKESASDLAVLLAKNENRDLLLSVLQGVVAGFNSPPLTQDSAAVRAVIKAIKDHDTALPQDLSENAMELRSVAAIAAGELLTQSAALSPANGNALLTALCLRTALSLRSKGTEKHVEAMFDVLKGAGDKLVQDAAHQRRRRSATSLNQLEEFSVDKESEESDAPLSEALLLIQAALVEVHNQAATDREELETLWWMFAGYSEVAGTPLSELSPSAAAFCSGVELAERALLPPAPGAMAMVDRAVQTGRKSAAKAISLEDAIKEWTRPMIEALLTPDAPVDGVPEICPALLPVAWACKQVRNYTEKPRLEESFGIVTGISGKQGFAPAIWGSQIFLEKIVLRALPLKEN